MGRQREKERLLCGQPVCEEVGRAPVASQWASVNHMAPSPSPSRSFFSLRWRNGQCGAGPSLPLTAGIIIFRAHTPKTRDAILIKPCWRDTAKNHAHMHTHTHNVLEASSSTRLPCGQTKEKTFCINLILVAICVKHAFVSSLLSLFSPLTSKVFF